MAALIISLFLQSQIHHQFNESLEGGKEMLTVPNILQDVPHFQK